MESSIFCLYTLAPTVVYIYVRYSDEVFVQTHSAEHNISSNDIQNPLSRFWGPPTNIIATTHGNVIKPLYPTCVIFTFWRFMQNSIDLHTLHVHLARQYGSANCVFDRISLHIGKARKQRSWMISANEEGKLRRNITRNHTCGRYMSYPTACDITYMPQARFLTFIPHMSFYFHITSCRIHKMFHP